MDTVAKIIADALGRLGYPPVEWFHPSDAMRIIRERLAYHNTQLSLSDQRAPLAVKNVNYGADDVLVPDVSSPSWVEKRITTNYDGQDSWQFVPTVNIDSLQEWRNEGIPAAAFYFDSNNNLRMRLSETWTDSNLLTYRIWHIPVIEGVTRLTDSININPNFAYLLSAEIRMKAIPVMLQKTAILRVELNQHQVSAWEAIRLEAEREFEQWSKLFDQQKNQSLGARRGRSRRPVLRSSRMWG